jgi:predicted O-methyltransferase YrrM
VKDPTRDDDLSAWVGRLCDDPGLLAMAHNQRAGDRNLGLGWLYYALARVVHPRRAVVVGSYRGFVPLLLGRAFQDNREPGEVTLIEPSLVDDFWKDAEATRAYFRGFGLANVRHYRMTTQQFVATEDYRGLGELGLLFVDGYHSAEQARFDYRAFEGRLAPHGIALFHDSMTLRRSDIYGADRAYDVRVRDCIDELKRDPGLQLFDLPYGTGLTLVRKRGADAVEPLLEGRPGRP